MYIVPLVDHNHQDRCRKETSKNDAAWSFIIEDLTTSNRGSVAMEGSCFSFLFLCRVNCEFSVLQYFFLKHMVLENSATCLAKLFKPDEVNISRATFMFGGYGRLLDIRLWNNLFCVNLIFRNGIVLKPADSMRMEKQGQLGGKVFCLLTEGNFCSLKVTVASWVGQTYVLLSLKLAALVLKQCPGKPLWIFFPAFAWEKDIYISFGRILSLHSKYWFIPAYLLQIHSLGPTHCNASSPPALHVILQSLSVPPSPPLFLPSHYHLWSVTSLSSASITDWMQLQWKAVDNNWFISEKWKLKNA